jgi:hypothetical protein
MSSYLAANCDCGGHRHLSLVVGLPGLVALAGEQRTQEFAVQFALGASHFKVFFSVLPRTRWPVLMGLLSGVAISAPLAEVIRGGLRSTNGLEPWNYAGAMVLLIAVYTAPAVLPLGRDFLLKVARIPGGVYCVPSLLIRAVSKPSLNDAAQRCGAGR